MNLSPIEVKKSILLQVVEHGMFVKHCKVEVYYIDLKLVENSKPDNPVKKKFSKSDTIGKFWNPSGFPQKGICLRYTLKLFNS